MKSGPSPIVPTDESNLPERIYRALNKKGVIVFEMKGKKFMDVYSSYKKLTNLCPFGIESKNKVDWTIE